MECRMKKLVIGILVFSFSVALLAGEENLNGFRKMNWEESIEKYKNDMFLTSEIGSPRKFYTIKDDEMFLGDTKLTSIAYVFYKGKFSSVILHTDRSADNLKIIFKRLKNDFGKPTYVNRYDNKYRWKNKHTNIKLKCFAASHMCSIIYNSAVMSKLEKADNKVLAQ